MLLSKSREPSILVCGSVSFYEVCHACRCKRNNNKDV
uniref:Uncharacterized protein n=1 Tax=Siphoviridae sp. ctTwu10 TaxID=2825525 RepID=A0A8S5P6K9_9CAUD|nr:MAG TPA: hypothetical protein [Siphoviridae sp. ctTwu10]